MAGLDFGLGAITEALTDQAGRVKERQAEQIEDQKRTNAAAVAKTKLAEKGLQIQQGLVQSLEPMMKKTESLSKARETQEALRSSGSIWDMFQAEGNAIIDPDTYTREGRARTQAELQTEANSRTFIASQQAAVLDQAGNVIDMGIKAKQGDLNLKILAETQGQERINAEILRVQTQAGVMANNIQIQDQILSGMSTEQVRAAAVNAKGQPVNIQGAEISPGALEVRIQQIDALELARRTTEAARIAKDEELVKIQSRKELEIMSPAMLRPLLSNGDPEGRYKLEDIKQVYDIKMGAESENITRSVEQTRLADIGSSIVVPAGQEIQRMKPGIPAGTPLEREFKRFQTIVGSIANSILPPVNSQHPYNNGQPPQIPLPYAIAASRSIEEQRAVLDKAIESQATLGAKGDKNLKEILVEKYRGNPVPKASVEAAVYTRLDKSLPLNDVLPDEIANNVKVFFAEEMNAINNQNQFNGGGDKEANKQAAMSKAIERATNKEIQRRTDDLLTGQLDSPTNPLRGKVSATEMRSLALRADQAGASRFQEAAGLTNEEMNAFMTQGASFPDKGVMQSSRFDVSMAQNVEFLLSLDAKEAGLGSRYSKWWEENGETVAQKTQTKRAQQAAASGVQAASFEAYASPLEVQGIYGYQLEIHEAGQAYGSQKAERYRQLVSFDHKPEHRQAALLQFDGTLNDGERAALMKGFILPIIDKTKEQNIGFEETNILIEQAIDAGQSQDPQIAKLLKKVQANRPKTVENMESIMTQPFWGMKDPNLPNTGMKSDKAWLRSEVGGRNYQWYENLRRGE